MKRAVVIIVIVILILSGAISLYGIYNGAVRPNSIAQKDFNDSQLTRTSVTPTIEGQINENENLVYCLSFQLCWNELKNLVGEDIEFDKDFTSIDFLNKGSSTKQDIDEKSYVAEAGYVKDGIEKRINDKLKKINDSESVDFGDYAEDDIIAYSYLFKDLKFREEFESLKNPLIFYEDNIGVKVQAFGIEDYSHKNEEIGDQVEIIDYQYDDFIIRLKTESSEDEIILAKVEPGETLFDTIKAVEKRVAEGTIEPMVSNDQLYIPKFAFNISHEYTELINRPIMNKNFTSNYISDAIQDISFRLDEKGVVLESRALLSMSKSADEYKSLFFNKPFLLYMKENDAELPYFAMWIDNTELMTNYQGK